MRSKTKLCAFVLLTVLSPFGQATLSADKVENDKQFHAQLLDIAGKYESFGKVDDMSRWAPWLCSAPPPPKARVSKSADTGTHGRKVYFLYAKERDAYMKLSANQVGQIIVKESWMPPAEVGNGNSAENMSTTTGSAKVPTQKKDLFIMMKLDPAIANSDDGWVYGTVTPDGKTVTSAGRVQSCMSCHTNAQHGRLFGLKN